MIRIAEGGALAAGYAESGNSEEAMRWQKKAVELKVSKAEMARGKQRLQLYSIGKPFRDTAQ